MRHLFYSLCALSFFAATGCVSPPEQPKSIASLSSLPEEVKTELMVLATPHLTVIEGVDASQLEGVLAILEAWQPDLIALERIPATEIALYRSDPTYDDLAKIYVGGHGEAADAAQAELGLSGISANHEMEDWPDLPASGDMAEINRRLLVALAAYEMETALLYWRKGGKPRSLAGLNDAAVEALEKLDGTVNERVTVGLELAERLDLARVWSVDSHMGDTRFRAYSDDLMKGIEEAGGVEAAVLSQKVFVESERRDKAAVETGDFVSLYDFYNSTERGEADIRAQWDIYHRLEFPNDAGRQREAIWDERNYRIAANLRHATSTMPGGKVLLLIGAAHKPSLDALLAQTLDVKIVHWSDLEAQ